MREAASKGWLPVSIDFDPHTAILGEGLVHWLEIGGDGLADAFLHDTVRRLQGAVPPPRVAATELRTLDRFSEGLRPVTPAGFIFHVSRCGSTLISNALKTAPGTVVVSEPPHVMQLLLPGLQTGGAYATDRWERTRSRLLATLFTLMAHYRTGHAERLILKFPSLSILSMTIVRALWPSVPCLVVVRDPVEVIVANLAGGIWMDLRSDPARSASILGWEGGAMAPEEFCARALGQYHRAGLEALGDGVRVVDYEELTPAAMPSIFELFGAPLPSERAALDRVLGTYSKGPGNRGRHKDDRGDKQRMADYQVRVAALRWSVPSYRELRSRPGLCD